MSANPILYKILAETVLVVHFGFVLFVVLGFMVIWAGYFLGWRFVRNFYFRLAHLVAIGIVAAESLLGMFCPLTEWEARLRWLAGEGERYESSFMQYWIHRLMFFDLNESVFTLVYIAFFGLVVFAYWWIPPERRQREKRSSLISP
jgi:hypothetical protein